MSFRFARVAVALAAIALVGCASVSSAQAPAPTATVAALTPLPTIPARRFAVQTRHDVAYGPLAAETLDICTPVAPGAHPGVILIHGGGWEQGDKGQYDAICSALATLGIVAATLSYRLAPAAIWPAQLVDVQLAVRWLRAHAGDYDLDAARLCSWGDSAGGHLAVFLGVDAQIHTGDAAGLLANESPAVTTCVVDAYGPVDLIGMGTAVQQQILQNFLGATPQQNPAAYRDASPLFLVSDSTPPTLIIQGTEDTLVPPSQSLALQAALQAHHIPVRFISYVGDHALAGLTDAQKNAILQQIATYLVAQLKP